MRKMKDSKIEWVGEIPEEWGCEKLKFHTIIRNENLIDAYNLDYIALENIESYSGRLISSESQYEILQSKIAHTGDVLFGKLRPYLAKVYHMPQKAAVSSEFLVLTATTINMVYLKWYLLNCGFIDEINASTYGVKMPRVNEDSIKNCVIPIPSLEEQRRIADFLDRECERIDGLKADIEEQIETLEKFKRSVITEAVTHGLNPAAPMKDSDVPWIGNIPEAWNCIKGKYILKYLQKPVKDSDGVITCFRDGEVTLRSNRREDGFTMADKEIGYQGVDIGDLVVHGMDGFAGAIGISDSRGKASPVLNVLATLQNKKYLMYYLRSMAYNEVFTALSTGIRVRSCDLRWNKLAELLYPVPPLSEQQAIADYLDEKCAQIDELISQKHSQIETLEAYKKSLIFEYVTGKKEVI